MRSSSEKQHFPYYTVWGDTVRLSTLSKGLLIAVACALVGLYGGKLVLGQLIDDQDLVEVLSLVSGLAACVLAGVITARLAPPARTVTEEAHDSEKILETIDEIASQPHGLGSLNQASAKSRQEMDNANLTRFFEGRN